MFVYVTCKIYVNIYEIFVKYVTDYFFVFSLEFLAIDVI